MKTTKTHNRLLLAAAAAALALAVTAGVAAGPLAGGIRGVVRSARAEAGDGVLVMLSGLLDRLDLSAAQRAEIRAVLAAHEDSLLALVSDDVASHQALRDAIRRPEADEGAVRTASVAAAAVDADLAVERARIFAAVVPILDEAQRAAVRAFAVEARVALAGHLTELLGDAEGRAERLERLAGRLDLDAAQREEIRAIFTAHRGAFVRLLVEERATREALHAAIRRVEVDEAAIRRASAAVAAVDAELAVERAEVYAAVYNELTAAQQARLEELLGTVEAAVAARVAAAINIAHHLL